MYTDKQKEEVAKRDVNKKARLQYIVLWGDAVEGHEFIGPFNHLDEAISYCEEDAEISDSQWNVALLQKPSVPELVQDWINEKEG